MVVAVLLVLALLALLVLVLLLLVLVLVLVLVLLLLRGKQRRPWLFGSSIANCALLATRRLHRGTMLPLLGCIMMLVLVHACNADASASDEVASENFGYGGHSTVNCSSSTLDRQHSVVMCLGTPGTVHPVVRESYISFGCLLNRNCCAHIVCIRVVDSLIRHSQT